MQDQQRLVSVIIPTYNSKPYVQSAIDSVLNQTYNNYQLIIVDDASPDGTADWIAQNYPDLNLVRLPKNKGAAGARNEGIKLAKGELVAFLDSDDQWLPNFLETHVKVVQENQNAVLTVCDYLAIKRDGSKVKVSNKPASTYPDLTHHLLMYNFIPTMSLVMIRREALFKVNLLDEALKITHDMDLYLRLSLIGELVHIPQNLAVKVDHPENLSADYKRCFQEVFTLLDKFFLNEGGQYKHLIHEAKSQWALNFSKWSWRSHRDFWFTSLMLFKAFVLSPLSIRKQAVFILNTFVRNRL